MVFFNIYLVNTLYEFSCNLVTLNLPETESIQISGNLV